MKGDLRADQGPEPFSIPMPMVIERIGRTERVYDIYSRLFKDRIIVIGYPIYDMAANLIVAQLLQLNNEDQEKPIKIFINSPGGVVTAGLAIYDTMRFVNAPISTICVGQAASMGAVLLAAGTKGMRKSLPNSRILLHQPLGGVQGQASDIQIQAAEIGKSKTKLMEILALHTGQSLEKITKDADRDFFLSPEEAKEYGVIDEIVATTKSL
ncbi:MAG: ATP-dependent Clp protease proteolytic subunit [bacterium]|nr:ATP-dependent Clp protease proteolytic subunit [bacterium]